MEPFGKSDKYGIADCGIQVMGSTDTARRARANLAEVCIRLFTVATGLGSAAGILCGSILVMVALHFL